MHASLLNTNTQLVPRFVSNLLLHVHIHISSPLPCLHPRRTILSCPFPMLAHECARRLQLCGLEARYPVVPCASCNDKSKHLGRLFLTPCLPAHRTRLYPHHSAEFFLSSFMSSADALSNATKTPNARPSSCIPRSRRRFTRTCAAVNTFARRGMFACAGLVPPC
jgi:hypothetical protein